MIDTGAIFQETGKSKDNNGNQRPLHKYEADDPDSDERWTLRGLQIGLPLDHADLTAMLQEFWSTGGDCIFASVTDNGRHGEGLWLTFTPATREGKPETHPGKFGTNYSEREPTPIFGIKLEPTQALILGEALVSVAKLRAAQGDD